MSNTLHLLADAVTPDVDKEPGDQTGTELRAKFFAPDKRGWAEIYHCKDDETRETIARFMELAVSNGQIGYSSAASSVNGRNSLFRELTENDNIISKVKPCNCDCSSLAYQAVRVATGVWWREGSFDSPIVSQFTRWEETLISGVRDYSRYLNPKPYSNAGYIQLVNAALAEKYPSGLFEIITAADGTYFMDDSQLQRGDLIRTVSLPEGFVAKFNELMAKEDPPTREEAIEEANAYAGSKTAHIAVYI